MIRFINLNENNRQRFVFDKSGNYLIFLFNLSGKFFFDIKTEGINLEVYGLFIGKGKADFYINTIQNHQVGNSISNLLIKGVFFDESKFHYQGLIKIGKQAHKSHAYQKNQNLLLSSKSFIESKPYLEIEANDVFCTHGSTTGKLNQEQIIYLKSRGLNENQAKFLLISGFVNEIFDKMRNRVEFRLFQKYFFESESLINKNYV